MDRSLKTTQLVVGKNDEERLEQHNGFAQAGVQVKVRKVNGAPVRRRFAGYTATEVFGGMAEVIAEVFDHFDQDGNFVEKLRSLRQQDLAEQIAHPCGALSLAALEIGGVQWSSIRNGAVMPGVFPEGTKKSAEGRRKAAAKIGNNVYGLARLGQFADATQLQGFIEGDAKHGVHAIELLHIGAKNFVLLRRQPSAPILLNG